MGCDDDDDVVGGVVAVVVVVVVVVLVLGWWWWWWWWWFGSSFWVGLERNGVGMGLGEVAPPRIERAVQQQHLVEELGRRTRATDRATHPCTHLCRLVLVDGRARAREGLWRCAPPRRRGSHIQRQEDRQV